MAHEHEEGKETNKKIQSVTIEILDDGSFSYQVHTKPTEKDENAPMIGETHSYSYEDVDDLLDDLEDDLKSPHFKKRIKKPRLGSGERFAELKSELARRGDVKNPGAVAAYIGRKKYGKARFQKLAAAGRRRA